MLTVIAPLLALAPQGFVDNTSQIPGGAPGNQSPTEQVDFADVDLDGDWDAVFADGGDNITDQNRIWINQGFLQGGAVGTFLDETASRLPMRNDQSRDVEFADIDGDGDPDLFVSNTSSIINDTGRFLINSGGLQGGTPGFFVEETSTRWVGLGGPGSSIPPSFVFGSGGFVNWSSDTDFGDVDNDGDLDFVHSSYGGAFAGGVPTRIFLNNGAGFFSEFNPSGFQLGGGNILEGNPALWCEGLQQDGTTDTTGSFCDIAAAALDVDLGDIDGDFDLDILLGDRDQDPRMFANRLDASPLAPSDGSLAFRDVSHLSFPPNWAPGTGHFEQEMGDLDGDGDLDIYGLNWNVTAFAYLDVTLRNLGGGMYAAPVDLAGSGPDDEEGDFVDYDNDGDLDIYTANFSGEDRLHENLNNGGPTYDFVLTSGLVPSSTSSVSKDVDVNDVDGDGDYDLFIASSYNAPNLFLENTFDVPDVHPPYLPQIEIVPNREPGPDPTVVRVHVYDNAPYYVTYTNVTMLEYTADGGPVVSVRMQSSGGQVFRGEIPGNVIGTIHYNAVSSDRYGNAGFSQTVSYTSFPPCAGANFCSATPNSTGSPAEITSNDECRVANNALVLSAAPVPDSFGLFFYSGAPNSGGAGTPFGNGLRCVGAAGSGVFRLPLELATGGVLSHALDLAAPPQPAAQVMPGSTWFFQAWFRDASAGGAGFDLSDGLEVVFQ